MYQKILDDILQDNHNTEDGKPITLTTYKEYKEKVDIIIDILARCTVTDKGLSLKLELKELAILDPDFEALGQVDGIIDFIILLDDNKYIKTVDFAINTEINGEKTSIFLGIENTYSKTAFKLPANATMD